MAAAAPSDRARAVVARSPDTVRDALTACAGLAPATQSLAARRACIAVGLGSTSFVGPAVVTATLAHLADLGVADPTVLAVIPTRDRDAGWDLESLAERHGLTTARMVDAWEVVEPADVGPSFVISGRPVPAGWQQADVRVVISPSATDAIEGYALVLDVLSGLVPSIAGADPVDLVTDILQTMAPTWSIIDASVTSDGPAGTALRHPVSTDTVVVTDSAVLADLIGATLLGTDPLRSPLVWSVVDLVGLPADYTVAGDLSPFPGLIHPAESAMRAVRGSSDVMSVRRVVSAALADEGVNSTGDDVVMAMLRQVIRPWLAPVEATTGLAWAGSSVTTAADYAQGWRTTFAKDSVPRRAASLGLDLSTFSARDYEAAESTLRPLLQLVEGRRRDRDGLRWMRVDGAIVFEASRVVEAAYVPWIERVDVAAAISMMADYLGGRIVVVTTDKQGRTTRQAERNIYLPQPNYLAFSGGQVIDVCKLSVVRHRADSCAIWWRTVRSPNRSAIYDDGTVEFADNADGRTRIVIRGRQQFALPSSMAAVDLDLTPEVRDALTDDAYRRFFLTTLDNFEACFEGREFAIGRDPDTELPTIGLSRLATVAKASVGDLLSRTPSGTAPLRVTVDETGFTHVPGGRR